MYLLLLVLGVLLLAGGVVSLIRRPHTTPNIIWGIVLVILGLIVIPGGLSLR